MTMTLTATFDTRREADMTVERLTQEHGIDRSCIFVAADGGGAAESVADTGAASVSVDLDDDAAAEKVKDAFVEFNSAGVVEN